MGVMPLSGHRKTETVEAAWLRGTVYEFQSDITFPANVPFLLIGCISELQEQADRMRQLQETAPGQRLRESDAGPTRAQPPPANVPQPRVAKDPVCILPGWLLSDPHGLAALGPFLLSLVIPKAGRGSLASQAGQLR